MSAPVPTESIQGAIEAADAISDLMIRTTLGRRMGQFDWYTPSRGQLVNELIEQYSADIEAHPKLFAEALLLSMARDVSDEAYDRNNR